MRFETKWIRAALRPLPFCLCLFLAGCKREIDADEYERMCRATVDTSKPLSGFVFYQGTKDGYDYFLFQPHTGQPHAERVISGEVDLEKRMPYTEDREQWIVTCPDLSTNAPFKFNGQNLASPPARTNLLLSTEGETNR